MPNDSTPAPGRWTTPGERQEAARRAYRQSSADGRPLSGVQLGTMFDRSARWGVDRIAEVRSDDHHRSDGSRRSDAAPPIGRNGNSASGGTAGGRSPALLVLGNGNGSHASAAADPHSRRRNGNSEQTVPIRSASTRHLPIGNNNGTSLPINGDADSDEPPEAMPRLEPDDATAAVEPESSSSRYPQPEPRSRVLLDTAITLVVAMVAAAASYGHMLDVAVMAGEPIWIARAFPVTVDGLVLAALRRGDEGRGWLAFGAAVSVAANVLAQFPELAAAAGPIVSAWPPFALYGTHRLLARRRHLHLGARQPTLGAVR